MNELSRHIEYLLLSHDCVVIPQFGAFVTQWFEATCVDEEELFIPPQRSIRFNSSIVTDDGLLVRSIQDTYRINPAEAKRKVQTLVLDLRQQLLTDGGADFGSLGQFSQDEDGVLSFEPCSAGVAAPAYFGLDALLFPRLQQYAKTRTAQRLSQDNEKPRQFSITTHGGDIDIHIGHRVVRNIGVAAALAVLFFLLPTHVSTPRLFEPSTANIAPIGHSEPAAAVPSKAPSAAKPAPEAVTPAKAAPRSAEAQPQPAQVSQPTEQFVVVLASALAPQRAQNYAAELTAQGLTGVRVMTKGKMVRVVMGGFLTEERAYQEVAELRERSSEFASAWVMRSE